MTTLTTTVLFDKDGDGTYETNATADALSVTVNYGRTAEFSQCAPGTCQIVLDNNAGTYSPRNSGLRPLDGVQIVTESQNIFHGFIRRIFQHPEGDRRQITVDCADWLYILSRTDVSLPIMRNVRSAVLAQRIVDLAEVGEHVDNPRFKDDLTGYSDLGVATGTRVTTGYIMEGQASCEVTGLTGTSDGLRYAIPHDADSDFQSVTVTASAYVWNEGGEDTAGLTLRLADNTTTYTGTNVDALREYPQRVQTSATFNVAATDFYIDIIGRAGAFGAALFRVGAVHCVTSANAIPRDFTGSGEGATIIVPKTTFEEVAPHRRNALRVLQEVAENELNGLVYVDEAGNVQYEAKDYRWVVGTSTASQATFDESMTGISFQEDLDDLVGEVEIHYRKWEVGAAGTVVFQLFPVPRTIGPGATLTLDIDYGALVRDVIEPVANTDYYIRSTPTSDTAGSDESGNVTVSFEDFGEGAQVVITSALAYSVFLTSLRIRGTPVRTSSDNTTYSYSPAGAPAYASKLRFSYNYMTSSASARTWAEYLGDRYVTQRERIPVALVNKTAALTTQQTTRRIGQRITLTNDNAAYSTMINGDYYIDHIRHRFSQGATSLETTWECVPVDLDYAIWDSDSWDDASAPWAP